VVDARAQQLVLLREAEERADQPAVVAALARLTERCLQEEDYDAAVSYCRRYLDLVQGFEIGPLIAVALGNLGVAERRRGNYEEAVRCYERQLDLVRAAEDPEQMGVVLGNVAVLYAKLGNAARAFACFEEARRIAELIGDVEGAIYALANLGSLHRERRDLDAARGCFDRALELDSDRSAHVFLGDVLLGHAELELDLGDPVAARSWLDRVALLPASDARPDLRFRCELLSPRASSGGDHEAALAALRALLAQHPEGERAAKVHHLIYKISGDPLSRRRARVIFRQLYAQRPDMELQRLLAELEAEP